MDDAQHSSSPAHLPSVVYETSAELLFRRARETQERARSLAEEARRLRSQRQRDASPPVSRKELIAYSPYVRLAAKLETMPVVEQAKGILMAQARISETEAFALLRSASQRTNVPLRDIAARIVASTARAERPAQREGAQRGPRPPGGQRFTEGPARQTPAGA